MAFLPNTDLVVVSWLKTLPGVPSTGVATSLPGDSASWAAQGFVQAQSVAGVPGIDTPLQSPIVQIDCWANNVNSQKPPWGKAGALAQAVLLATYDFLPVEPPLPGDFETARILSVYPMSEPAKVTADEAGFARYMFELSVNWVAIR